MERTKELPITHIILMAEIISIKSDLRNQSGLEALITRLKAHSRVTNARTDEWYGNWSLLLEYVNRPSIEDEKAYHRIKSKGRGYLSNVLKRIGPKPAIDSISINKIEASYKPFQDIFIVEIKNRFAGEFDDMEFEQFLSWLKSVSVFGAKTIAHKPEDSKIYPPPLELLDTVWYMYHYQYSRSNRHERPETEITRLVLWIDPLGDGHIFERHDNEDWGGRVTVEKKDRRIVISDLKRHKPPHKNLQIRFELHDISVKTIMMGQYIDVEDKVMMISGNFVLQNVEDVPSEDTSTERTNGDRLVEISRPGKVDKYWILTRALSHHEDWNKEIPQPIAEFLKNKGRNFTKIKTDISSLKSLDGFLKTQKGKTIAETKYNEIIRYDAFIVAPTPRMDSEEYKDLMELYREITETFFPAPIERKANNPEDLEKCFESSSEIQELTGFTRLFFPTRVHHARTGKADWSDRDVPDINDEEMKAMSESRCVIFILDRSKSTSALVKCGWAMAWEKVTFVVGLPKEMLPKVLRENYRKVLYVATKNIDKVSEIPQWLATKVEKNVLD